jgi:hypothetical protein
MFKSLVMALVAILSFAWMASCSAPDPGQGPLQVDFGKEVSQQYRDILFQAESLEIVALNPDWPTEESRQDPTTLHGYGVRGRAVLEERSLRLELLAALARGTRENDTMAAACFNPRHAIIAESNGQVCEVIICFECLTFQIWDGTTQVEGAHLSETPCRTFDRIFADAGLSVDPHH